MLTPSGCKDIEFVAKTQLLKLSLFPYFLFYSPLVGVRRSEMLRRFQELNHNEHFLGHPAYFSKFFSGANVPSNECYINATLICIFLDPRLPITPLPFSSMTC